MGAVVDIVGTGRVAVGGAALAALVVVAVIVGMQLGRPDPIQLPMVDAATVAASLPTPSPTTTPAIHVHVAGEVRAPGLYRARGGSRVADLVDAAGGPTPSGDVDRLNLASVLSDGDRIEVPAMGEPFSGPSAAAAADDAGSGDGVVDVNRASPSELEALPGIGPALAAAIVEHRERFGPFASGDDLTQVPGIGPATVARLADRVRT